MESYSLQDLRIALEAVHVFHLNLCGVVWYRTLRINVVGPLRPVVFINK